MATPIDAVPEPPAAGSPLEAIVLGFPEPAVVFDRRRVCTCINESGARALGVNLRRVAGLGVVALGLPAPIDDAILGLTDPLPGTRVAEREILCSRGSGARRFHVTPHHQTGAVLVTWSDLSAEHETTRQLARLHEAVRALRDQTLADGRRRRGALARVRPELERAAKTLSGVAEELTAQGWDLPPSRPPDHALVEETRRLRAVLQHLAQLDRDEAAAQAEQADVIEL